MIQCELSYKSIVTLYSQQTVVVFIISIIPLCFCMEEIVVHANK